MTSKSGDAKTVRTLLVRDAPACENVRGVNDRVVIGMHLDRPGRVHQARSGLRRTLTYTPGEMTLIAAGNDVVCTTEGATSFFHAALDPALFPGGFSPSDRLRFEDPLCRELLRAMMEAGISEDGLMLETAAATLGPRLAWLEGRRGGNSKGSLSRAQTDRLKQFMWERVENPPALRELADQAGLSVWQFCRAFRISTGGTAHGLMTELRIERARGLLRGGFSVLEAAHRTGFSNPSQFARVFRERTGISPSDFLRTTNRRQDPVDPAGTR